VVTAALIVAAGMIALAALARLRTALTAPPITTIATAPDATLVRIRGRVSAETVLHAPYSSVPCVYYRVELSCAQFNRKLTYEHSESCDFAVTDATGTALVLHERAQFEARPHDGEATRASKLSERALAVIRAHGWDVPDIAAVAFTESVIAIGDDVDVAGITSHGAPVDETRERGFRDAPPTQLVFAGAAYVLRG
jgi:hypothetical protein